MSRMPRTLSHNVKDVDRTHSVIQVDIRGEPAWKHAEDYFTRLHSPAFGKISSASDLSASKDGDKIAFTAKIWDKLEGSPSTRICVKVLSEVSPATEACDTSCEIVTRGPNNDSHARWSPDGKILAFLSDREEKGINQLYLLKTGSLGEAYPICKFDGAVEYFHWSSDGYKILVAIAGRDADAGDAAGSGKIGNAKGDTPDWMPSVKAQTLQSAWRQLHIYDVRKGTPVKLGTCLNIWEANWYGENQILAITSTTPGEEAWYEPLLVSFSYGMHREYASGGIGKDGISVHPDSEMPGLWVRTREIYRSKVQLGNPVSTPSGRTFAFLEALSSDRAPLAGNIILGRDGQTKHIQLGADITHIEWRDESNLFCMGIRGLNTISGELTLGHDGINDAFFNETWASNGDCGGIYPTGTPLVKKSSFAMMHEGWDQYPEMYRVENGSLQVITSFTHSGSKHLSSVLGEQKQMSWQAPDGLEIQGFLALPKHGQNPYPLILSIHGGPVYSFRNRWPGSSYTAYLSSLGYAILSVNPRGSSGRGQGFAAKVLGDIGGAETQDHLSGIDAMVERGIADPNKIGVIGASHGGFMTSWIISQDGRFKAAVPIAAVNDWRSQHTTSNISTFDFIFHQADPYALPSKEVTADEDPYLTRSPLMHVRNVKTPVLQIAGSHDLCVPSSQAQQFHNALKECGVESALVIYPQEGHGVSKFPAFVDFCARIAMWFQRLMPADEDKNTP